MEGQSSVSVRSVKGKFLDSVEYDMPMQHKTARGAEDVTLAHDLDLSIFHRLDHEQIYHLVGAFMEDSVCARFEIDFDSLWIFNNFGFAGPEFNGETIKLEGAARNWRYAAQLMRVPS